MPFNSFTFLLFFLTVFSANQVISSWRYRKLLLLFSSQLFYAAWDPPLVLILWVTVVITWYLVHLMSLAKSRCTRMVYLVVGLTTSLGSLAYFKYGTFLLENFTALASNFGIDFQPASTSIILPIGISFYTFHALSYTIDVYRRQITAATSLADFALYMSFFPQLVAGPIVRASQFLPQLAMNRVATHDQIGWGFLLIIVGLFQKIVLADSVFAPVVDQLYEAPARATAWDAWIGIFAFSGQIFCDFAGYSTCAIGLASCFGFHFPENFRSPYGALGFSDFWRRWHISLSSWLRDYLYISIGGGRGTPLFVSRNLLLTMLVGGIWHGASWMFLLWGGLHGVYLVIERFGFCRLQFLRPYFSRTGLAIATFVVISLTWIPFRATDTATASGVLSALFRRGYPNSSTYDLTVALIFLMAIVLLHISNSERSFVDWFSSRSRLAQAAVIGLTVLGLFAVSGGESRGFIYFQF